MVIVFLQCMQEGSICRVARWAALIPMKTTWLVSCAGSVCQR